VIELRVRFVVDRDILRKDLKRRDDLFRRRAGISARLVTANIRPTIDSLVASRLDRTANPGRGKRLERAINRSIRPKAGFRPGIVITDPNVMYRTAIYWRVIELGGQATGHIESVRKVRLMGFGVKNRRSMPGDITPPSPTISGQPDAIGVRSQMGNIKKPIKPHGYMRTLSKQISDRYVDRVGKDLDAAFGKLI
jgi:hypothetical protein